VAGGGLMASAPNPTQIPQTQAMTTQHDFHYFRIFINLNLCPKNAGRFRPETGGLFGVATPVPVAEPR
jgi:hypothetical protein